MRPCATIKNCLKSELSQLSANLYLLSELPGAILEPPAGVEPATYGLQNRSSTN